MTLNELINMAEETKDFINKQIGNRSIHEIVNIFCEILSLLAVDLATFSGREEDKTQIIRRFDYLMKIQLKTLTQLTGIEAEHKINIESGYDHVLN